MTAGRRAVVDASLVIAALNADEPSHGQALNLLAAWDVLVLHTVNLAEILAGVDRGAWDGLLAALRANGFEAHHTTAEELAEARLATALKMPDACVIAVAKAQHVEAVLSLDARLVRAAREQGFACPGDPAGQNR
ncbi:MAG: type II toxin-antitoxin system VapC family toxin [Bifidobacteriaceae bacterium]|nr:type II toxin-antitoxin system VapC family toxin [Bifidobacteriaceae bacterium]